MAPPGTGVPGGLMKRSIEDGHGQSACADAPIYARYFLPVASYRRFRDGMPSKHPWNFPHFCPAGRACRWAG